MNKSILIIDTPDCCRKCILSEMSYNFGKLLCIPTQKTINKFSENRPDWCPLREVPKEKELTEGYKFYESCNQYQLGWNRCLEELLKENNNE